MKITISNCQSYSIIATRIFTIFFGFSLGYCCYKKTYYLN